jgi:hypothetical protein
MSEITLAKAELADHYTTAGIKFEAYVPERIVPPVVIMNSGSTYLRPDTMKNGYVMGLELTLIAPQAVNEQATNVLDALIENVLTNQPDFALVIDVAKPYILQANNAEYLATTVNLDLFITL